MKLAVLGGTSQVDHHLLDCALRSGYSIHFLGHHAGALAPHPELTITTGSSRNEVLIEETLGGAQAVICLPHAVTDFETLGIVVSTMHAFGIRRLILAADLYQAEPRHFKTMLQKADIDWTFVHYAPAAASKEPFKIADASFAKYLVRQVTDAAHLRAALLLSS